MALAILRVTDVASEAAEGNGGVQLEMDNGAGLPIPAYE